MGHKISVFDVGVNESYDATGLAELIKNKSLSVQEVVQCAIERSKIANTELNAIVTDCFDKVEFPDSDSFNSIFYGVPTFIKDLINVKGLPTYHGSNSIGNKIFKKNEKIADQFLSTGLINLGKTTTSEFGLLPAVETIRHGDTRNSLNTDYSTGGSSGGAAALVRSGAVPIAHAADGGGSIRIPASCCGLIGLKPSRGRDIESPTSKLPLDIVCQGVLSRTVRDSYNYYKSAELFYTNPKIPPIGTVKHKPSKKLKIAFFTESPSGIASHPDVVETIHQAASFCEQLGHQAILIKSPFTQETKIDFLAYWSFVTYMLKRFGKLTYGFSYKASKLETFTSQMAKVYPKIMFNTPLIVKRLKAFSIFYEALFEEYDVLLNPVLSHPVPEIGYFSPHNNYFSTIEKLSQYVNFTIIQNITGAPSISLPMGKCKNGLPIGAQFSTKFGADARLLELAFEIESNGGLLNWDI